MKNNKKFWILFAIIIALSVGTQLVAQDVKETTGEKVVKTIQDWDFKKYRHRQMMMKHRRKQMRTRRMIQTLFVAGASYYIGYKVGEDSWKDKKKDGGKRPPIMWRD